MIRPFKATIINTIFVAVFFFAYNRSTAQTQPVKKLLFETIGANEGLSQGMVNCIIQDHYGFMWFATKDGLNRYDGYHFVVYRHDPSDSNSIAENYIEALFEDSKGRLWVGTATGGLEFFNRETETFQHFKKNEENGSDLGHIIAITEDKQGKLWLTTEKGIVVLEEKKSLKNKMLSFSFQKINNKDSRVYIIQNGTIFVYEVNGSFYTIIQNEAGKETIDTIPEQSYTWRAGKFERKQYEGGEPDAIAFAEDTAHRLLYMFMKHCITTFDERENKFKIIHKIPFLNYFNFTSSVNVNTIWLVNNFNAEQFDINTAASVIVGNTNKSVTDIIGVASCVCTDKSGILWIGTTGYGIFKYNVRNEKFHHTDIESIHWMQETNDAKVMLVKEGAYLYIFDKDSQGYIDTLPPKRIEKSEAYRGILDAAVQDNDGTYWMAKIDLVHYDDAAKKLTRFNYKLAFPIYKNKAGEIWFGGSNALCCYDKINNKIIGYPYPIAPTNFPYKSLQAIWQADNGIFWLGTTAGLLRFDPVNKSWKVFKNAPADSTSISFDLIFSLCPDPIKPNKYLWTGTSGGGLNCFDMETGKAIRYSVKNGLANDVVYGILSDNDGNLWMSTNNGLSKLSKDRRTFYNYNVNNGLQGNEFNRNAFCKTKDGTLFFGGVNGFNYFDPYDLDRNNIPPNIVITDFKIGNKPVTIHNEKKLLTKSVEFTDKIVLDYSDNMISFEFAAMDFMQPSKNLYQYKMEGFDKDWIYSGTARSATYTNLDPGTYTFYVKGSNSDGVWNDTGTSIQLIILPPWYMTWWFRILVLAIIAGATYAFYRYRLNQALKLQAVRNRIAGDLHDEIGSNLSTISIFSDLAKEKVKKHPEAVSPLLNKISNYTHVSMDAMSDIVWMINAGNDRFENIIIRMREVAVELTETKKCLLHLNIDEKLNMLKLGMQERKNFYLIYKEALNNIVKYAEAKNVWIELGSVNNTISLVVKDDGKGFDISNGNSGNGLKSMKSRAAFLKGDFKLITKPGEGTLIKLIFKI